MWRRRVIPVGLAYLLLATLLAPTAAVLQEKLGLPGWMPGAVLAALGILFVPVLWLAWTGSSHAGAAVAAREAPVVTHSAGTSIAVLPFANLSREPADEVFADGMVEDLITGL